MRDTRCGLPAKGPRKSNLGKCRVILREPQRLKNPLSVRELLRSLGLPQDDMNGWEFRKLFFREPLRFALAGLSRLATTGVMINAADVEVVD